MRNRKTALLCGATLAFILPGVALAQTPAETPPQDPANQEAGSPQADDPATTLDDVVVTVERREQNLQDYAGTAVALSGADLKAVGVQDITDLEGRVPGLSVANNGGNIEIYIRGVGSSNNTELGDPAAATHYDGVYLPRPAGIGSAFFDIQRVEVNIGPQGTLRGRNATAGSVNIVTWKPGLNILDASAEFELGNYQQRVFQGMLNLPVGETAALRIAGYHLEHDSYYTDVGPAQVGVAEAEKNSAGRVQFLWEPDSRWSILLGADYIRETGSGYTGTNYANPLGEGIDPDDIEDPRRVVARAFTPELDTRHWGARAHIAYDGDLFDIEYTASYRDLVYDYKAVTPLSPFYPGVLENLTGPGGLGETLDNFSQFQSITDSQSKTHELRFYDNEGPWIWSAGAFYLEEDQYSFLGSTGDRGLFFQGVEFNMPDVDTSSYALYADTTYSVTDRFRLTGGLRYTEDEKSRRGVAARYGFAIGGDNFSCCGGVRVGTEGFEFAGRSRSIFNPDTDGNGTISDQEVLDFYFNGVSRFGARDNVQTIFGNGPVPGGAPNRPPCLDTITGDFFVCPPDGTVSFAVPFAGQIFQQVGESKVDFVDWRLRAEYDLTDDNLLYGLITTGNKSGGFNDNIGNAGLAPTYGPETVTLYEVGSKNEFYVGDYKARLNGSLFYNDYSDQVLTSLLSVAQIVDFLGGPQEVPVPEDSSLALVVSYSYNAAKSRIYGAQFEGGIDLPWNLGIDFNLLYLKAEVTEAEEIQDFRFQADVAPTEAVFRSIEGKTLPRTPEWQFNINLTQAFPTERMGQFDYVISSGYRSSMFTTIFNGEDYLQPDNPRRRLDDKVDGYWTFDVGFGWTPPGDGRVRLEGFVNNLTDEQNEAAIIITQFDNTRFFTRPRTFGARLRVQY
ncbi:MAG: TonB-dependent receptor [Brevundimonas sp.]|uniref:TonB-dependent receptor n=1 Tax=Brevundimonas sp. TaxID=1871086 RepID=UPI001A2B5BE0|nr:TonB-dependent receptor [Brevundimonas sp.]MBJ7446523.1 TonB-dependent receptor [Brevundimonas sp.]